MLGDKAGWRRDHRYDFILLSEGHSHCCSTNSFYESVFSIANKTRVGNAHPDTSEITITSSDPYVFLWNCHRTKRVRESSAPRNEYTIVEKNPPTSVSQLNLVLVTVVIDSVLCFVPPSGPLSLLVFRSSLYHELHTPTR